MSKGSLLSLYCPSSAPARRLLCTVLLILFIIIGIIALSLYLVYRPSKPRFTILSAAVYQLSNATNAAVPANAITTSMQFTIAIRNPSNRAAIRYDRLSAYVSYRGEAITPTSPIPNVFQEMDSTVAVSPVLGGGCFPVSAEAATGLMADEGYGVVGVRLVVLGRLKYKTGPFRSGWNGMYVRCNMLLGLKKGVAGQVPLLGAPDCGIDV